MFARRTFLLTLLCLGLLAGCSRGTVFTVNVDALSFMDDHERRDTLPFEDVDLRLPDDDGLAQDEVGLPVGAYEGLERLTATVSADLSLDDAATGGEVVVAVHVVGTAEDDPFQDAPVARTAVAIGPGETMNARMELVVDDTENAATLATLRSGAFRIGVRLASDTDGAAGADGDLTYELDAFDLSLSASGSGLLDF